MVVGVDDDLPESGPTVVVVLDGPGVAVVGGGVPEVPDVVEVVIGSAAGDVLSSPERASPSRRGPPPPDGSEAARTSTVRSGRKVNR